MFYILIAVWMTSTFIQSYSFIRNQKTSVSIFMAIDLIEIQYVSTAFWFVEAHANFILHKYSRRELC